MRYRIRHRTTYDYPLEVSHSQHLLHLEPRATPRQTVERASVLVTPLPAERQRRIDAFGNAAEWLTLDERHATLEILSESEVVVKAGPPPDAAASLSWEQVARLLEVPADEPARAAVPFLFDSPYTWFTADLAGYARPSFAPGRPYLSAAVDLMRRIYRDFRYDTTVTDVSTPVDKVFALRAGVCQDLAHLGIACLRALGLPVRYVSGYLLTHPAPGKERLQGADASHAWFAVWTPPFGWVDLDPTNNLLPGDEHITLAWGRDYGDVAPINGVVVGGGEHSVDVGVDVVPV